MSMLLLAFRSLIFRRGLALLCVFTVALSSLLLLGVDRLRYAAKEGFTSTVSSLDLIVGPRMGDIQLLMQSVFFTGTQGLSMPWSGFVKMKQDPRVEWAIPLSFGESHEGLPVVGTTVDYFKRVRTGDEHPLQLSNGAWFAQPFDIVLGSKAAQNLDYVLGQKIILHHGEGHITDAKPHAQEKHQHSDHEHEEHVDKNHKDEHETKDQESLHAIHPFKVVGVLQATGTPIDNALFVDLDSLERIHDGWDEGGPSILAQSGISTLAGIEERINPQKISAVYLGLKQPESVLSLHGELTRSTTDVLTAVIPAVGLSQVWQITSIAETTLQILSLFAVVIGLLGMMGVLLAGLQARKQEMQILRMLGARPYHIGALIIGEAFILTLLGLCISFLCITILSFFAQNWITLITGVYFSISKIHLSEVALMLMILVGSCLIGAVPALQAYRYSKS